jgi:hypothetical protein
LSNQVLVLLVLLEFDFLVVLKLHVLEFLVDIFHSFEDFFDVGNLFIWSSHLDESMFMLTVIFAEFAEVVSILADSAHVSDADNGSHTALFALSVVVVTDEVFKYFPYLKFFAFILSLDKGLVDLILLVLKLLLDNLLHFLLHSKWLLFSLFLTRVLMLSFSLSSALGLFILAASLDFIHSLDFEEFHVKFVCELRLAFISGFFVHSLLLLLEFFFLSLFFLSLQLLLFSLLLISLLIELVIFSFVLFKPLILLMLMLLSGLDLSASWIDEE